MSAHDDERDGHDAPADDDHDHDHDHDHDKGDGDGDGKGDGKDKDKDKGKSDEGEEKKPSPLKNPKVRIALIVIGIVVLVALAAWFTYYWTRGRFLQSTDDAFLQADQVTIASKVPGYVAEVYVQDNQTVEANAPLVRIDGSDVTARVEQAQAQVDQALAQVQQAEAQLRQQQSQVAAADGQLGGARANLGHAQEEVDRYTPLVAQGAHSEQQLDQLRQTRDQAAAQVVTLRAQRENAARQAGTLGAQRAVAVAQVEQARAQLRQAQSDHQDVVVRSSIAGRIGDKSVRVGQYVQPATRLMSVVPVDQLYLVANFKETQIGLMRIGQPADIHVDALPDMVLHGEVQSFAPGTGAQFALLPPQNATGNFTKVVQRVPVRIHVDAGPEARRVLLAGLSATVKVDTLGAKHERDEAKEESKRGEKARDQAKDSERERDRTTGTQGPGR
jgi:membrane fusion protein (multidrug efflux system)